MILDVEGVRMKDNWYPENVIKLVSKVRRGETENTDIVLEALKEVGMEKENCEIVMRYLCKEDKIEDAFSLLHLMKEKGVKRSRESYRPLILSCCKYDDLDYALLGLELMIDDGVVDWISFKRIFDTMGGAVDRRIWVTYDVIKFFLPLNRFALASMRLTGYITEIMDDLKLGESKRSKRGYITLPNPIARKRTTFDWDNLFRPDPVYEMDEEGNIFLVLDEEEYRLDSITDDFEDINNLEAILKRVRDKRDGLPPPPPPTSQFFVDYISSQKQVEFPHRRLLTDNELQNFDVSFLQDEQKTKFLLLQSEKKIEKQNDDF